MKLNPPPIQFTIHLTLKITPYSDSTKITPLHTVYFLTWYTTSITVDFSLFFRFSSDLRNDFLSLDFLISGGFFIAKEIPYK